MMLKRTVQSPFFRCSQKSHLFDNFRNNKELNVIANIKYEKRNITFTYCLTKRMDVITSIHTFSFTQKTMRRVCWEDGSSWTILRISKNTQEWIKGSSYYYHSPNKPSPLFQILCNGHYLNVHSSTSSWLSAAWFSFNLRCLLSSCMENLLKS